MRRAFVIASVCVLVLTTLGACSSVPDLTFSDGDAAGTPDGPGSEGSPFVEGGPLVEGGKDANADADGPIPGCIPQPEICDDGIDNDCDRHTDCDDPDCNAGFACVPAAPSGWQLVGFSAATQPTCPTGFGAATAVSTVSGSGAGTCACNCSVAAGSTACNAGQTTIIVSDTGVCSGGVTTTTPVASSPLGCASLGAGINIPSGTVSATMTPPAPPLACGSATTISVPALTAGEICAPPARVGAGCGAGQVCAPKPVGVTLCAAKAGSDSCPATFPKLNTAGTSGTDGRACNDASCNCAPQASCNATMTLFSAADCSVLGANKSDVVTTACAVPAAKNITALAYKATTAGSGCSAAGFSPASTGSIAWVGQQTVCCR